MAAVLDADENNFGDDNGFDDNDEFNDEDADWGDMELTFDRQQSDITSMSKQDAPLVPKEPVVWECDNCGFKNSSQMETCILCKGDPKFRKKNEKDEDEDDNENDNDNSDNDHDNQFEKKVDHLSEMFSNIPKNLIKKVLKYNAELNMERAAHILITVNERMEEKLLEQKKEEEKMREEAIEHKTSGNNHFQKKHYSQAVQLYTNAIDSMEKLSELNETDKKSLSIFYSNRAACYLWMNPPNHENVIVDCTKSLEYDNKFHKSWWRRACANEKMNKKDQALEDYKKVHKLRPSLQLAIKKINSLTQNLK